MSTIKTEKKYEGAKISTVFIIVTLRYTVYCRCINIANSESSQSLSLYIHIYIAASSSQ